MFRLDKDCLRDKETDEVLIDFSEVDKLKKRDNDEYNELTIYKKQSNFEMEVVNDTNFIFIRLRRIKNEKQK